MLFIIEDDIVEADDMNFLKCFENLLLGYIEGNHLLFIKPSTVEKIENIYADLMDDRMKSQFIYYQEKSMYESKGAYKLVSYAIKIVPNNIKEEKVKHFKKTIGYLHTDKFLTSATIQKTVLLGENPMDGDIYKIFAEEYLKYKNSNLKVQLKIENGGGNTTAPTFKRKIENGEELCLSILDCDKKFPEDKFGETAKRIRRETASLVTPKVHYHIEERCREMENMLPEAFYFKQYKDKISVLFQLDSIKTIAYELSFYIDMKEGLKHYDIGQYTGSLINNMSIISFESKPTCANNFYCTKKDKCKGIVLEGFGNNILRDFINFYNNCNQELELIINSSSRYLKKIWIHIGRLVFSWGCGQERNLANT